MFDLRFVTALYVVVAITLLCWFLQQRWYVASAIPSVALAGAGVKGAWYVVRLRYGRFGRLPGRERTVRLLLRMRLM